MVWQIAARRPIVSAPRTRRIVALPPPSVADHSLVREVGLSPVAHVSAMPRIRAIEARIVDDRGGEGAAQRALVRCALATVVEPCGGRFRFEIHARPKRHRARADAVLNPMRQHRDAVRRGNAKIGGVSAHLSRSDERRDRNSKLHLIATRCRPVVIHAEGRAVAKAFEPRAAPVVARAGLGHRLGPGSEGSVPSSRPPSSDAQPTTVTAKTSVTAAWCRARAITRASRGAAPRLQVQRSPTERLRRRASWASHRRPAARLPWQRARLR